MENPIHIVAAGSLVTNNNNQVLLVKTERRGWEIPGGQVEKGEDILSALRREILEEAGIIVRIKKLAGIYSSISQPSKMIVDFVSQYKGGEIKVADEIKDARWTSKTDAIKRVASEPMNYRLKWLLENNNRIRFTAFSKRPFQIISETIMNS